MYTLQENIKSQWARQILISPDSKIVALKYQEQWLLYNLGDRKSKVMLQERSGPGMFSGDSQHFITVGVNVNESHESVSQMVVQPEIENSISLLQLEAQVRGFDISESKLLLNFINGQLMIWDYKRKQKLFLLNSTIRYISIQFSDAHIIGTQEHCISIFDSRFRRLKQLIVCGQLSEYYKYIHYCDIKQVSKNVMMFRQSRGMEKFCFKMLGIQCGKILRVFRDCLRFENLNVNISMDHKQMLRLKKSHNIEIDILELPTGNSLSFTQALDPKQPMCFNLDWSLVIQSTKQGYAKVFRKN